MGSTYKLEFSNQVEDLNNMNQGQPYELKLDNGVKVIIKKYDNDSFTMLLPSGETLLYTVSPNSEITQLPSIKINDQNNVIQLNNFSIGLIFFTLIVQRFFAVFGKSWTKRSGNGQKKNPDEDPGITF